jgi:hypothetical protein
MIGNYIKAVATAVSRTTAQLMKTGQTTSYRTGDDGDLEAGRNVSFTVLAENNPFGNTNRFTDELGGQTYTNNIVIDWSTYNGSTVLGWRRTTNGVDINWNDSIDGALAVSVGTFTTGWRLPNIQELISISNYGISTALFDYSPFSLNSANNFWSSTTLASNTTRALLIQNTNLRITDLAKTATVPHRYIPCRTFTVTGTTLS